MIKEYIIYVMLVLCVCSCTLRHNYFASYQAQSNKKEVEKVLKRYKQEKDIQKIKATEFLVKNMPYHSFLYSDGLVDAKDWFRLMRERPVSELRQISDSIVSVVDPYKGLKRIWDKDVLDSAYICENIDMAFKVWREQPWGENVSFDLFCKYILPYRIYDEIPERWRKIYYDEYNHLLDEFRASDSLNTTDPLSAYRFLINKIPIVKELVYTSISPVPFPHVGAESVKYNTGTCKEFCDFIVYLCRSVGIPCALNYRLNEEHFWITIWDAEGNEYVVNHYPDTPISNKEDELYQRIKLRVFRYSYELNNDEMKHLRRNRKILPKHFCLPLWEDVTERFTSSYTDHVIIPVSNFNARPTIGELVYLCTPLRDGWVIEDYSKVGISSVTFNGVQVGNLTCVARKEGESLIPVTEPFIIGEDEEQLRFFEPSDEIETVILKSKYHIEGEDGGYREVMRNGVFEASNSESFITTDTLVIIQSKPDRRVTNLKVYSQSAKKYKYVRYKGPDGSYCVVADICFYDSQMQPVLYDKIIGTQSIKPNRIIENVFDGNASTSYESYDSTGGWCGLELMSPTEISYVSYTPRNRVNYIYEGNEYELFYYEGMWNSLGRVIADSDTLVYDNVPKDALLFLKNHTTGVKEMVFTYNDGVQYFPGYTPDSRLNTTTRRVSCRDWECSYTYLTPQSDWSTPMYDASCWEKGRGPFGLNCECPLKWSSKNLFIRYEFIPNDAFSNSSRHLLKGRITTNYEIYLNGEIIGRGQDLKYEDKVILPDSLLLEGNNVIAIKCVNRDMSDSNLCDFVVQ